MRPSVLLGLYCTVGFRTAFLSPLQTGRAAQQGYFTPKLQCKKIVLCELMRFNKLLSVML